MLLLASKSLVLKMWILTAILLTSTQALKNYPSIDKQDLTITDPEPTPQSHSPVEGFFDVVYVQSLLPRSKAPADYYKSSEDDRYEPAHINGLSTSPDLQLTQSESFKQSILHSTQKDFNLRTSP